MNNGTANKVYQRFTEEQKQQIIEALEHMPAFGAIMPQRTFAREFEVSVTNARHLNSDDMQALFFQLGKIGNILQAAFSTGSNASNGDASSDDQD